jgi:hypothetical protein
MDGLAVPLFVLAGIGVVALLVVLIVASVRRERARQRRIRGWAAHHGWMVTSRPALDWASRLPGQHRRGVSLMVSGTARGWHVGVAEYSYTTESMADSRGSRSTTTHHLLVTAVRVTASYPPIAVHARGGLSRLGRAMFGDNAAATGHDAFDRRFRVSTKDPRLSSALLGPALITEHLAGRVPEWSLAGDDLLTWRSGHLKDPRQIPELVAPLVRVAGLLGR